MTFFAEQIREEQTSRAVHRGLIYARYSSDMQDTSDSIEVQISECKKYALAHEIVLVHEPFVDRAETGTSTENRKAYQELLLLAQSKDRDFDTILTFHTSRWGRGIQSEIDEYLIEKNGIKIIAVSQPFTADDAVESVFMKGILRKIDAYYSMQASKYTHAYQTSNAVNGFKNGGAAPDGYAMEYVPTGKKDRLGKEKMKSRLALDPQPGKYDVTREPRHKLIEFSFLHAQEGKGLRWLTRAVFQHGWRSRYSADPLSPATIRNWLTNPAYTGYMVWNRVKFFRRNGNRTYKHNPVSKWVFSQEPSHPVIVSKEIFEAVATQFLQRRGQGRMPRIAAGEPTPKNSTRYLVSGILKCGLCGAHYVAGANWHSTKKNIQVYMMCNTKWRHGKGKCANLNLNMAVVEGAIMDALCYRLLAEEEIKKFIEAFNRFIDADIGQSGQEITDLIKLKQPLQRVVDNIKAAIMEGADSKTFVKELVQHQTALDDLQARIDLLQSAGAAPKLQYDPSQLGRWVSNLRELILQADFDLRRELLRNLVKEVVIQPDRTAKMTWDLPAVVNLFHGQEVPSESLNLNHRTSSARDLLKSYGCGGRI